MFERAYELRARALLGYDAPPRDGLAHPFGTPDDAPEHRWRVSPDVYQALYNEMPPAWPIPNPKSGDDGTTRLFGWLVVKDRSLPPNSMLLEVI